MFYHIPCKDQCQGLKISYHSQGKIENCRICLSKILFRITSLTNINKIKSKMQWTVYFWRIFGSPWKILGDYISKLQSGVIWRYLFRVRWSEMHNYICVYLYVFKYSKYNIHFIQNSQKWSWICLIVICSMFALCSDSL